MTDVMPNKDNKTKNKKGSSFRKVMYRGNNIIRPAGAIKKGI